MTYIQVTGNDKCPYCRLNWGVYPPAKIDGAGNLVRCVECKQVYGSLDDMNKNSDLMGDWDGKLAPAPTPARCEPPEGTAKGTWHVLQRTETSPLFAAFWTEPGVWQLLGFAGRWSPAEAAGNWVYRHPLNLSPPVADPHAALKEAVVEAASRYAYDRTSMNGDAIIRAVETLRAAMSPPDPAKELAEAWEEARCVQPAHAAKRLDDAVKAAIAKLNGEFPS
jgi:hypothetical protein